MNKVFLGCKLFLLALLIVYASCAIVNEKNPEIYHLSAQNNSMTNIFKPYYAVKKILLKDPYRIQTLNTVESEESNINNFFNNRKETLEILADSPFFAEQLFSFMLFNKIENLDEITELYLEDFYDFKDLIIIDENESLIYKYGNESFTVKYYSFPSAFSIQDFGSHYGLIYKISDPGMENDVEIIALFDYSEIQNYIDTLSYPAGVYFFDLLINNERFPEDIFEDNLYKMERYQRMLIGLKYLKAFPLTLASNNFGLGAIVYPVRSFSSYALSILKLSIIFIILCVVIFLDKSVINVMKKARVEKEEAGLTQGKSLKKSLKKKNEDEESEEKLKWIDNYIQENENENE